MWNNFKSDIYRITHMKAFYITLSVAVGVNLMLLVTSGFHIGSFFAEFSRSSDSYTDFLYYVVKAPTFMLAVTIFLCVFYNDEYDKGYAKNIMPIMNKKGALVVERYLICVLVALMLAVAIIVSSAVLVLLIPSVFVHHEAFDIVQYAIFAFTQILLISAFTSCLVFLNHITRSRILIILLASFFSASILYMLEGSFCEMIFEYENADILKYTIYETIGTLPKEFTWDGYKIAFFVLIGNTLLYNGLSYIVLKKKDI